MSDNDTEVKQTPAAIEETQEVKTAETEGISDATEGDEVKPTDGEDLADEQKEEALKPKVGGVSKKIGKLTRKLTEREREIEYLREQLAKSIGPKQAEPVKEHTKHDDDAEPNPENFETHADYVKALFKHEHAKTQKQEREKSRAEQAQNEFAKQRQEFVEKAKAFSKEKPDYDEVLESVGDVQLSITVQNAILKHGPALAYELAKDPDELTRLCEMNAIDAAEEIGEIRARIRGAKTDTKTQPKTTQAPKPPTPLAGKSVPTRKSISDPDLPFAEYVKLRKDSMRRR